MDRQEKNAAAYKILDAAIAWLASHAWCQGHMFKDRFGDDVDTFADLEFEEPVAACTLGAIALAAGGDETPEYKRAVWLVAHAVDSLPGLGWGQCERAVTHWNDNNSRTLADVVNMLEDVR